MDLFNQITAEYTELTLQDFNPLHGKILLADDGDGVQYIAKWEYEKTIPTGLNLGKPAV